MTRSMSITPWSQKAGPGKLAGFGFTLNWSDESGDAERSPEDEQAQQAVEGKQQRTNAPRPAKGA